MPTVCRPYAELKVMSYSVAVKNARSFKSKPEDLSRKSTLVGVVHALGTCSKGSCECTIVQRFKVGIVQQDVKRSCIGTKH